MAFNTSSADMVATLATGRVRINNTVTPNTYTVVKGDSLYKIARRLYGNGERWSDIYNANTALLSHPGLIREGMVLNL
ncbi:MAG: LysM peptidoglycan-binding domain-containing protein [Alphaproteobacteria bacterium]|nr:LysM peptidoglycan-binding domain-containing protein [Alphaproteobacteria bacterium]